MLFSSVGGPKWENLPPGKPARARCSAALRKHFKLFGNLRPAKLYQGLEAFCPLRADIAANGFDILCVRSELTGESISGQQKAVRRRSVRKAFDTEVYHRFEIERIAVSPFSRRVNAAVKSPLLIKANVLPSSILWREIVNDVAKTRIPMWNSRTCISITPPCSLIKDPSQFDVLLCSNLFGILSDECAMITGSIGDVALRQPERGKDFGLYEPAGGSAPDMRRKNIALSNCADPVAGAAATPQHGCQRYAATAIERAIIARVKRTFAPAI
ncbi:hypothetical protein KCP76_14140 [Salmonella enterica subsp. enterica serovar Weltevreden]|nr:hypothetical protein KCP76_14140 [Salmonella enterica subsp. enterica serovar Weltevreden]